MQAALQVTVDPIVNMQGNVYIGTGQAASPSTTASSQAAAPAQPAPAPSAQQAPLSQQHFTAPAQGPPSHALSSLLAPAAAEPNVNSPPPAAAVQGLARPGTSVASSVQDSSTAGAAPLAAQPNPEQFATGLLDFARLTDASQNPQQPLFAQQGAQPAGLASGPLGNGTQDTQHAEVIAGSPIILVPSHWVDGMLRRSDGASTCMQEAVHAFDAATQALQGAAPAPDQRAADQAAAPNQATAPQPLASAAWEHAWPALYHSPYTWAVIMAATSSTLSCVLLLLVLLALALGRGRRAGQATLGRTAGGGKRQRKGAGGLLRGPHLKRKPSKDAMDRPR